MEAPNLDYIKRLSGGDVQFERKLIEIIKSEFPEEWKTYQSNVESGNLEAASQNVHKLKHKFSILGLEQSYDVAVSYETELKDGKTSLRADFEVIMRSLAKYIMSI